MPGAECSPECIEQQAASAREDEIWAENAARDRARAADEAGRAQAYDFAMARWRGE